MNIEDLEKTINSKLKTAPSLGAQIKFDLGNEGVIHVDGNVNPPVVTLEDKGADATFVCSSSLLTDIIDGKQDPTMAFMMGKLKIKGSMGVAMKLASLMED